MFVLRSQDPQAPPSGRGRYPMKLQHLVFDDQPPRSVQDRMIPGH